MGGKIKLVNGQRVVDSGVIVAKRNDVVEILPFPENDFKVFFKIKLTKGLEADFVEVSADDVDGSSTVQVSRSWDGGSPDAQAGGVMVAEDDTHEYLFNFSTDLFGQKESFTYYLIYNIVEAPK